MSTRKTRSQINPTANKKRRVIDEPELENDGEENEESSDSELDEGDDAGDADSEVASLSGRGRGRGVVAEHSRTPGPSSKPSKKINIRSGVTLSLDEMVQNCLYYFLINQQKKIPVKRIDLINNAMNGQNKSFKDVMAKLEQVLDDVFGMKVVGLEATKSGVGWSSYIIISHFNFDLAESVTMSTHESDSRRAVLFILLCIIFMLNRSIDEDMVSKILHEMNLHQIVCKKKEDLGRFLKSEYVTPMYLSMEEINDTDTAVNRYSWGPRSEKEFSKSAILKFVAKQFPGKKSIDFTVQYNMLMESEKELVEAEMEENRNPDGDNGSALAGTEEPGCSTDGQGMHREVVEDMDTVEEDSDSGSD